MPDPFQTSGWLALLKAFYLSAGEEKPAHEMQHFVNDLKGFAERKTGFLFVCLSV